MKKFFTLSVMLLFTGLLFAERPSAKLTISNNSKSRVTVSVDGQNYIAERGTQNGIDIFISDLRAGYHSVKIYQQDNWGGWWGDRNMNKIIYNENLLLRPQCRTDIIIGKHNKVSINEQLTGWGNGNNDGNWDKDDNRGGWHHNGQWNNGSRDNNYRQPMDGRSFDQLKYLINRTYSDNDKLNVAKQAISLNYFNAWQIKEMMQLLNFEGNKLDLAKYGYAYTLDRQNYYQVNDALGYNSSRVELARFIQQQQR